MIAWQWENGPENDKYKSEESLKWSADTQSVMADVSCSTDNRSKTNIFVVLHARYKDSWSDLLPLHDGNDRENKSGMVLNNIDLIFLKLVLCTREPWKTMYIYVPSMVCVVDLIFLKLVYTREHMKTMYIYVPSMVCLVYFF